MLTIWIPMLATDTRGGWHAGRTPGPQFWDGDRVAGTWLANENLGGLGYAGVVWDAWFLFGPDAVWNERPAPLAGSGTTVIGTTDRLASALAGV